MGEAQVISLVALAVAFLGLLLNSRKDTRQDAAETARVQAKLDSLINGVDEIRLENICFRYADGAEPTVSAVPRQYSGCEVN